jgi:hypothetical protein
MKREGRAAHVKRLMGIGEWRVNIQALGAVGSAKGTILVLMGDEEINPPLDSGINIWLASDLCSEGTNQKA